jgi:hypothetical protein
MKPPWIKFQRKHQPFADGVAMLLYLSIVQVWGLWVFPLGRDYDILEKSGHGLPFLADSLFAWEVSAFGAHPLGYHLVNLAMLYGCMLLLYRYTNLVVRGPCWFGTLAATLFMANPVHAEAVLNLSGVGDLTPCLLALATLVAYGSNAFRPGRVKWLASLVLGTLSIVPYAQNVSLGLVLILFEVIALAPEQRIYRRLMPFVLLSFVGVFLRWEELAPQGFSLGQAFAPLYFIFYPIGFLPETARNFHEHPGLAWLAIAAMLLILFLICRKTRRRAIFFGLLAMPAVQLFATRPVDPVHLVGGGRLLLANALFNVAFAALFFRIMDHPKWRVTVVSGTTALCMVFFALQIRSNRAWHHAGERVRAFQIEAAELARKTSGEPMGLVPDYRYYRGAPLCLSEAIVHDTPFNKAIPAVSLLPLHYDKPPNMQVSVQKWTPEGGIVVVSGKKPLEVACWPYELSRKGTRIDAGHTFVELLDDATFTLSVTPKSGTLPRVTLPVAPVPWKESKDKP